MMKKNRLLLILSLIVVVLLGTYLAIMLFSGNSANSGTQIKVHYTDQPIDKIAYSSSTYGQWALVKQGDNWQVEGDSTFPLNSELIDAMLAQITPLYATSAITDNLLTTQEYGLDEPYSTVTLTSGGAQTVLTFGDVNPYTTDTYMTVTNHSELYTVSASVVVAFDKELMALAKLDVWPITSPSQISEVSFKSSTLMADGLSVKIERTQNDTAPVKYLVNSGKGDAFYASTDPASILISNISSLYYTAYVTHDAQQSELATYGLSEPILTLEITATGYDGEDISTTLHVGDIAEDGTYYVQVDGSKTVNKMDGMFIGEILNASADNLR